MLANPLRIKRESFLTNNTLFCYFRKSQTIWVWKRSTKGKINGIRSVVVGVSVSWRALRARIKPLRRRTDILVGV